MGQFFDHDMTFDTTSRLGITTAPEQTVNARTPSLDLDSVYGNGPFGSPQLYDSRDRAKLRIESGGLFEDVPRQGNAAVIADPRNDENVMIAGLQTAFIRFHNNMVDLVREDDRRMDSSRAFSEARRLTTWHYHWLILKEFLPQFVGQARVDSALRFRRFYRPSVGQAFMPVEFQGACYRFGHSMVRPSYRANLAGDNGAAFFGMIFDPAGEGQADPVDLRGNARAPRRFIGWQTFFDFGDTRGPAEQADRHEHLDAAVQPAAADDRQRRPADLAAAAQPAPRHHVVAAVRPVDRAQDRGDAADRERAAQLPARPRPVDAALLLHAEGGGGRRGRPAGSARSAARSSPRCSSACCRATRTRGSGRSRTGGRRCRGGSNFRMVDFLRFAEVDPASRGQ